MNRILALALFALVTTAPASAQEWPTKTVRFVVPFGAGSTPDIIARLVSDKLQAKLGQNFIVENKAGASGMTGTDAVAKADPDGHTIGISLGGALAINTLLFSKMPYDPAKEIALVTILTNQPSALIACGVRPTWPITGMPRWLRNAIVSAMRAPPSSLMAPQPVSFRMRAAERKACSRLSS